MDLKFSIPDDSKDRHEVLVKLFGALMMDARDATHSRAKLLVESDEDRSKLGSIFREPFENIASMTPEHQSMALEFMERGIDSFAYRVLMLFAARDFELKIRNGKIVRFTVNAEICDESSEEIIFSDILNRNGMHFPDYWGHWKNDPSVRNVLKA